MVTKTCFVPSPPSGVFECDKPINVLMMIWDGIEAVRIKAWKGAVGSTTLLADVDNIAVGDEVTVSGFAGSPNDDKSGFINQWLFEGMAGNGSAIDCIP